MVDSTRVYMNEVSFAKLFPANAYVQYIANSS